jgi:signal transduction histidine kinase
VNILKKQIMDILLNLVENAFGAIAGQGGVSAVRSLSSYPNLQFEVTDTGSSIPLEHQSTIFNMFCSAQESCGLGLPQPLQA